MGFHDTQRGGFQGELLKKLRDFLPITVVTARFISYPLLVTLLLTITYKVFGWLVFPVITETKGNNRGLGKNTVFEARTLSEEVRTVLYNEEGEGVILTLEEVKRGKRLFNVACASCHVGGLTKTNPNVGLDLASLNSSVPPRNNISSLVKFLNSPTSYDGFQSIAEVHPGIESCDLFPKMRTLTREDLVAISGHILLQTKILQKVGWW
jgi:photosystem II cytochrome c550